MFVWGVKRMPGSGVGRAPHGVKKYPEDQARRYTFRRPSRGVCTSGGLPCLSLCRTETVRRRACFKRPWAVCGEALVLVTGGRHKCVFWSGLSARDSPDGIIAADGLHQPVWKKPGRAKQSTPQGRMADIAGTAGDSAEDGQGGFELRALSVPYRLQSLLASFWLNCFARRKRNLHGALCPACKGDAP